jgi:acetyltransferase EpsM
MILFGASGHCVSVIDVAQSIGEEVLIIYDDNPVIASLCQIPVKKYDQNLSIPNESYIISIGDNAIRKNISQILQGQFGLLVHRTAYISPISTLGTGTVVMAKAVVNASTKVGKHCIINTGAVIEHDCNLEDFVHISPNASLAGGVSVGEGSHIGIGACVIPRITIGKWATVGAGAVIIKDIPDGAVVVGNPGRIVKYRSY